MTGRARHSRAAFTLIELLVVIAIIAILASLLLPALATAKSKAHVVTCKNNQRQIAVAWAVYQDDFNQVLAQNGVHGGGTPTDILWVYGWDHGNQAAFTNDAALVDPRVSLFAKYLPSKAVYKCPEDKSFSMPRKVPHVRSYAMNAYIAPTKDSQFQVEPGWAVFRKSNELTRPSDTFLTMDVYPDTLCMPHFRVYMNGERWFHAPSNLHRGSGVISFADAHVENHRWVNLKYAKNVRHDIAAPKSLDLAWVKARTTFDLTGKRQLTAY